MSRKLKAIRPDTLTATAASPNDDSRPRRKARERLKTCVLEELWSIWRANPRVPSIESRRLWAASRNASPHLVDSWFLRRRKGAKKAGQPLLDGSYDLSLDQLAAPRREPSAISIKPEQVETIPDLSSDDTLAYPPDDNNLKDMDASSSSDTVFDEDTFTELKGIGTTAYNQQLRSKGCQFQPKLSSTDLDKSDDPNKGTLPFRNPSLPICNQGMGNVSDFTCILCSELPDQGDTDEDLLHFDATSNWTDNSSMVYPRLDFSPDMLSELSAIPFLFRTPSVVLHETITDYWGVDDWSMVEVELGRLVNDGNLDFSFLDNPWFTSMELFD